MTLFADFDGGYPAVCRSDQSWASSTKHLLPPTLGFSSRTGTGRRPTSESKSLKASRAESAFLSKLSPEHYLDTTSP